MKRLIKEVRAEMRSLGLDLPFKIELWSGWTSSWASGKYIGMSSWRCIEAHLPGGEAAFKSILRHEIGHVFEERYQRRLLRMGMEKVFGPRDVEYPENGYLEKYIVAPHADYITPYARLHPAEDWADTFRHVLERGLSDVDQVSPALRAKLVFVRRAIARVA